MQPLEVFRPSFKAMLEPFLKGAVALGLALAALAVFRGHMRDEDLRVVLLLGLGSFSFPLLLAVVFAVPAYVYEYLRAPELGPEGVVGLDTLQRRRSVPWKAVNSAKAQSLGGLPEVAVSIEGTYWRVRVPLYLQQRTRFVSLVQSYAGAEHPIARALRGEA